MRRITLLLVAALAAMLFAAPAFGAEAPTKESVGKQLYFDTNLSSPKGQSCASCHDPAAGYADPDQDLGVSAGIIPGRFGNRNSPTSAYAYLIPPFAFDEEMGEYVGGQFWDGRASTLKDQAKGPFLNPLEMNMPSVEAVVHRVEKSKYAADFLAVFGPDAFDDPDVAYDHIADAIAAYESSAEVNPFSSKHDLAMSRRGPARMQTFTMQERRGMMLFMNQGKCSVCHTGVMMMGGGGMGGGGMGGGGMGGGGMGGGGMGGGGMGGGGGGMEMMPSAFSDFRYDNLGVPADPANPFYSLQRKFNPLGSMWVDHGLAETLGDPAYDGMFRVPTLRNVELTAPYGHNGYFKTLKEIVHFYNTRDVAGAGWPPAEVPSTVNHDDLGNLGLTSAQEDDIVAFLKTFTDGYWVK